MALIPTGLKIIVEGARKATQDLEAYEKAVQKTTAANKKAEAEAPKTVTPKVRAFSEAVKQLDLNTRGAIPGLGRLSDLLTLAGSRGAVAASGAEAAAAGTAAAGTAATGAAAGMGTLALAIGAVVLAVGTVTVAMAGFLSLGKRGAGVAITAQAFGNIVSGATSSTQVLQNLRQQTRGTISDLELMRLATLSLQGTTKDFRDVVAKDLGTVLDITQRVAQATGQSGDVVREKFLLGLRRQSAKLLDDVGVVIDAETAYRTYAESIGVASGALTDNQKQAAYAAAAIAKLKEVGVELGAVNPVLEGLKRPFVALRNLIDRVALASQPLFAVFTKGFGGIANAINAVADFIVSNASVIFQTIAAVVQEIQATIAEAIGPIIGPLLQLAGEVLPYVAAAFQLAGEAIVGIVHQIGQGLRFLIQAIQAPFKLLFDSIGQQFSFSIEQIAFLAAAGGAFIIGAFAGGLLRGGTFVVKAVTAIARIVADFLQGFSPPKKGPLSTIDEGGEAVARAWAEGFTRGILKPVEEVAQAVNDRLGPIASFTATMIASRLSVLDGALQPFIDALDIAKADLQAVAGFVDPALQAIDRQRKEAIKALAQGQTFDVSRLQLLDMTADKLRTIGRAEQARVDNAQLQLAIMQASQAQERALLTIQQRRASTLDAVNEKLEKGASEAAKTASATEKAAKAAAGQAPEVTEPTAPFAPGQPPDLLGSEAISKAKSVLEGGIQTGLAASGFTDALSDFREASGGLSKEVARIASANPIEKLTKKFDGLGSIANLGLSELQNAISGGFESVAKAGTDALATLQTNITPIIAGLATGFQTQLSTIQTLFISTFSSISGFVSGIFNLDTGAIALAFSGLFGPAGTIATQLLGLFGLENSAIAGIFGADGSIMTLLNSFAELIAEPLGKVTKVISNVFLLASSPIGRISDVVGSVLGEAERLFTAFASTGISNALSGLGNAIISALLNPFVAVMNAVIEAVESAINLVISNLPDLVKGPLGISSVFLGRVNAADFIPQLATGASGFRGLALVGERGPELVAFRQAADIFPAPFTRAVLGGGGNTSNIDRSISQTFQQQFNVGTPQDAALIQRQQMALAR